MRTNLALYWEPRACNAEDAASLMLQAFDLLREAGFSTFREKGGTLKSAQTPFDPNYESVLTLLRKGVNRRDIGRAVIPELGYQFSLWSGGREEESYELSCLMGATAPFLRNSFLLRLPSLGAYAFADTKAQVQELFRSLVTLLKPTEGILCSAADLRWNGRRLAQEIPAFERFPYAV